MMVSNRQLFLAHQAQTSEFPLMLEIERAEGNYLYDVHGKKYLDLISGISVSSLGHGNKKVIDAITRQAEQYMHLMVYGEFIQSPQVKLAAKLASLLPWSLNSVYLVNSGTEATEGALKLAKRHTGKTKIIACRNAYHGSTHGSLSLNSNSFFTQAFRPLLPDVSFIEFNEIASLDAIDANCACVVTEVIQGEAGYIPATQEFLDTLRARCTQSGSLLIFDEIQSGMGRSGKLFAFEHYHVVPDILLLGKALGAGMPMGAFVASSNIMKSLAHAPYLGHITTFGGHPVCAAAALAGIESLIESGHIEEIAEKERRFRQKLTHADIKNISGKGLMLALYLENFEVCLKLVKACIDEGLIADWFLFASNCLRIAPPLGITNDEIDRACDTIKKQLELIRSS